MTRRFLCGLAATFFGLVGGARALTYEGVNLAGAEFGTTGNDANDLPIPILPGTVNVDYTYPTPDEVTYYFGKGMNTFRLPFLWERLEPDLATGQLNAAQLGYISTFVSDVMTATNGNGYVILDPHNFGRYVSGDASYAIGSPEVPVSAYANLWSQLATTFQGNTHVMFGLMNEPAGTPVIDTLDWFNAAQSAVYAIRNAGATNTILAPGSYYTGAWSWVTGNGHGTPNALLMGGLDDPGVLNISGKNLLYEVHQYFDADYSGHSTAIVHSDIPALLDHFTGWLNATGNRGFLGEFGVSANLAGGTAQQDAVTNTLNYLEANSAVWEGWTWWAGGPWWGDYDFSLEPTGLGQPGVPVVDAPQMAYLAPFLAVPEPSAALLLALVALLLAYPAACTARSLTSPISSSRASSATRRKPSVASVSATCRLPS